MRRALFIFSELDDTDVEWMLASGRHERLEAGSVLIQQGEPIGALYILLDGQLSVLVEGPPSQELARLSMGEIVGEVSLVDSRAPMATVKAMTDVVVLSISNHVVNARLRSDPNFAARFYRAISIFLAYRLRDSVAHLGYGREAGSVSEIDKAEDELDMDVMDKIHLAGQRFERMRQQIVNGVVD